MVAQSDLIHERIGLGALGRRMSLREFENIRDWDEAYRYELLDGVLIVSPAASGGERASSDTLAALLAIYQRYTPNGKVLDQTLPEQDVLTSRGVRRVDRALWIGLGRPPVLKVDVPTILVEFVSAGSRNAYRDYVEKRGEYLAAGVKEYWVIDRFDRTMTVFTGAVDEPLETVVKESGVYSTPLLPGFALPLADILTEADKFPD